MKDIKTLLKKKKTFTAIDAVWKAAFLIQSERFSLEMEKILKHKGTK